MCSAACPRLSAKVDGIVHSPVSEALFHSPRWTVARSPLRPMRASEAVNSRGAPSTSPFAATLADGELGKPLACSSALTAPGVDP